MSNENKAVFYLFVGSCYYPEGGISDLKGAFTSLEDAQIALPGAIEVLHDQNEVWAQIATLERGVCTCVMTYHKSYTQTEGTWESEM